MATIKDFKKEIAKKVSEQKQNKQNNFQWEKYQLGGLLHAMYTAYFILKHHLSEEEKNSYINKIIKEWKKIYNNGWCGYSEKYSYSTEYRASTKFQEKVNELLSNYAEEIICTDKQQA